MAAWADLGADLPRQRAAETTRALSGLGVPRMMGFADGSLRADAPLDAALRDQIAETSPDLIVTHAPNDSHADHRALSQAVSQAADFSAPVRFMDMMNGTGFIPTHWVEVTPWWPTKLADIRILRPPAPRPAPGRRVQSPHHLTGETP